MQLNKEQIKEISSNIRINSLAFIDRKFCESNSGKTFESINPATTEVIANIAYCNEEDVDRAVKSARNAFNSGVWSRSDPEFRKNILLKIAKLVRENAPELAVLESMDTGKTITDCLAEISEEVPNQFQWYAELIDKTFGKVAPTGENKLALVMQEPIGVAGLVVPWNFPLLMMAFKLAPALASGCSAIVKPAEESSLTAIRFAELAQEAGVPDGILHVLPGLGEITGKAIGLHNDIDVVSFTGSTEIGRKFLNYASQSNLKSIGLEMGGKSPFIVLEDAKLNGYLIDNAATSAFLNGGQNCSANMRQIISKSIIEEFTNLLIERVKSYNIGNPLDPRTDIGSMISKRHLETVNNYIELGEKEGANIVYKGKIEQQQGYFVPPVIFDGLKPTMRIAKEEIFGPVLGIMPAKNMEEALNIASDSKYGLQATVFTNDLDKAIYMARRLPCGTISINEFSEGNITTPYGGYKQSGSLARDNGTEAMQQYLQSKTIWISNKN